MRFPSAGRPGRLQDRFYYAGETFEATEEEAAGWLQAGYVTKVEEVSPKRSRKKK